MKTYCSAHDGSDSKTFSKLSPQTPYNPSSPKRSLDDVVYRLRLDLYHYWCCIEYRAFLFDKHVASTS